MSYVALYRTYRPQSFTEVAGQEHITTTLKNALKTGKVAHAYLFSGPRGTGKTTIAKIMAKAVNCEHAPIENPCNECSVCLGITKGTISDVVEIDAASNNGVDEIRELRDRVKYLPSAAKYRVYIIDEVHMLSTGAFNALLKTLEEPPKHVIFILATTEPYKIPATILSRCQRFDFRGISISEIMGKLKEIAEKEQMTIDEEAIRLIAESAEGGLRDALSLLDQAMSFGDDKVTVDDVHTVSGSVSIDALLAIVDALAKKMPVESLRALENLLEEGKEIPRIISDMIQFFRDMLIYKNIDVSNSSKSIFQKEMFQKLAKKLSNQRIYLFLDILNKTQNDVKWTNQKRAYLELAFIKMVDDIELREVALSDQVRVLEDKMRTLETRIEQGIVVRSNIKDGPKQASAIKQTPLVEVAQVERILCDADKEKKAMLLSAWDKLQAIKDTRLSIAANLLYQGELVAVSRDHLLLVYDNATMCRRMMQPEAKKSVKEILNKKSELIKDYVAIPKSAWQRISEEFMTQWKNKIKRPTLSSFDMGVYEEAIEDDLLLNDEEACETLAKDFFGENLVKIEEEKA